jgi:hypothetical protein
VVPPPAEPRAPPPSDDDGAPAPTEAERASSARHSSRRAAHPLLAGVGDGPVRWHEDSDAARPGVDLETPLLGHAHAQSPGSQKLCTLGEFAQQPLLQVVSGHWSNDGQTGQWSIRGDAAQTQN